MQITINVKEGATAEGIARALRFQANLIDGMDPKKAASNAMTAAPGKKAKPVDEEDEDTEADDDAENDADEDDGDDSDSDSDSEEDEDSESDDDDDADADSDDDGDTEESEDEPAKKAKKLTGKEEKMLKEVNAALKARAKKTSFDKVKVWLKKKFKVASINDLKPSQFAAVIKAAKAA